MDTKLQKSGDTTIGYRRWEVYDRTTDQHLGWVSRFDYNRTWTLHCSAHVNDHTEGVASQAAKPSIWLGDAYATRAEAVDELIIYLEIYCGYRPTEGATT